MSFLTGAIRTAAVSTSARAALLGRTAPVVAQQVRGYAAHHEEESFDQFNSRYVGFFDAVEDLFELQRGLNNCFAYDLVPSPEVIESALRASRRVNDYSTAVRIFEGIKQKVENENQYKQYVEALKTVREELGIQLKEEMYSA
ncbi:probable cytochrome-c oxidase chain VI precursor [Melanopsichium pennsylvanicum]|uniref:Cytochrome c oxidase subunit 6, mitochondrial n=2 Tax=Melanopsichium pennsylvanicum TaxID=63383 RepID=A0AAJ4XHE0_9BASI|nr:probable cytochrome-c oxidase chain VI precursor [Melanopsichium pennsylvanicum 4]SNX82150.1 probable cytochrome-c oxidase chain VI precursor [Melanopsichium pennsylvanicum]